MQVFQLHFNPWDKERKAEPDLIFDSFCYEPENIYEKRFGSLFILGELRNVFPQNLRFLDNLAGFLRKNYYSTPIRFSPESAVKESLKKANEFLEGIVKKGDVSWLGNLNLAVLNLMPQSKKWWRVNFTKVGTMKILLLRSGKIIDIGKNLEFSEIEPYPLKIFGNIVSGKLDENDIILVLTQDVFSYFNEGVIAEELPSKKIKSKISLVAGSLLEKISQIKPFEERKLREILKTKEKELLKIFGTCLICDLAGISSEKSRDKKSSQSIVFRPAPEKFSMSKALSPLLKAVKKINFLKVFRFPKLSLPKTLKPSIPKISLPKFPKFKFKIFPPSKNLISVLLLLLFLFLGFFLFQGEKKEELKVAKDILEQVKSKKVQAENFLILKNESKANDLLQEAWKEILTQTKAGSPQREKALSLKKELEEELFSLNKLEQLSDPELLFEFNPIEADVIPQKMLLFDSGLYFFNPFSPKIYKVNVKEKSKELLETKRNIKLGDTISQSILFFSQPDILLSLGNGGWQERTLEKLTTEFNFDKLAGFKSSAFFLDTRSGEIVKYSIPPTGGIPPARFWVNPQTKKPLGAKSMAVDGSVWVLAENNEIDRYSGGFYKETLKVSFFPFLKNPTKIWTSELNPYLYILEPNQSRIVIISKDGQIIKQFQSEKFNNLLDFAVSDEGKTIYILNGLKLYQINFSLP